MFPFVFVQIALMMLVDNALNSALYNVWNWDNGVMLLVDSVFPFRVAQEQIRNVKPRHSRLVFEQKFIFRRFKGGKFSLGPRRFSEICNFLFVYCSFSPTVFYSVTFLIHSLYSYLRFNFCFFSMWKWNQWTLSSALFFFFYQTKPRVSAVENNPWIPHMHRQINIHRSVVFIVVAQDL